jgi:hypothetical protein
MVAYPVSRQVSNARNEGPELIDSMQQPTDWEG